MIGPLRLFFGLVEDPPLNHHLKRANPFLISLLVGQERYLTQVNMKDTVYLGKYLDGYPSLEQLEDLEIHLKSVLLRLAPNYCFDSNPIRLFTIPSMKNL